MNRRNFVLGPLTMAIPFALGGCRHHPSEHGKPAIEKGTLKVILNGPFAVVLDRNNPSVLTAFVPRDPDDMHRFYVNDLENDLDWKKNYHFNLQSRGLWISKSRPYIDQCFKDFNARTDAWQREQYFVTLELPVPDVISFVPPAKTVHFQDGTAALMPLNHVLEYRIEDTEKITALSPELKDARPISASQFLARITAVCDKPSAKANQFEDSCVEMRTLLSDSTQSNTQILFLGVGLPLKNGPEFAMTREEGDHAVHFFNDVLLRSFPKLSNKKLAPLDSFNPGDGSPRGMPMKTLVSWPPPPPRLVLVSAVIDCKVGGLIVTTS